MKPRAVHRLAAGALTVLACGGAGTCGGDGGDDDGPAGEPLADFAFTKPDGFAELVPTTTVELAWTVSPSDADSLELDAFDGDEPPIAIQRFSLVSGSYAWDGRSPAGTAAPPGNYRLRAIALGPADGEAARLDGDATHLVVVQGVRFRDTTLAFTGGQASRQIVVDTTARSPVELTLVLDPDVATDGDELPLLTATVPGEFASVARTYPFTGHTADDQPIAGGTYTLAAVLRARDGAITYRTDGPTLTWTP
ncbi:MAG TPA: hypothetical protein VHE35_06570 [Kofleriaceae bacterium]|nr:hypothetical protein [Kofleriaceae bacterium]